MLCCKQATVDECLESLTIKIVPESLKIQSRYVTVGSVARRLLPR